MNKEKGKVFFGKKYVIFFVKRSNKRKTVSLFVDPFEGTFLRAPQKTSIDVLKNIIHSRAVWILNKQRLIDESFKQFPPKEYINGESFLYLGKNLKLKITARNKNNGVSVSEGRFNVNLHGRIGPEDKPEIIRNLLIHWYKKHAGRILLQRVTLYSKKLGISVPEIVLVNQKKRWGSCSKTGRIRLNWRIVMAPVSLVDYVVAHELCHLKFDNHSRDFWKTLGNILPDYEVRKERLRKEGANFYI